ncbi:MAG TPA: GMC family oxidoreductase [Puia sp.]|nr:GMC family oxidoreductase [Puia sp.]
MIIPPKKYKAGTVIETDICIIGGGPAAISLALSFLNLHSKIIILTGGTWKERSRHRALNKGVIDPVGSHEPLEENRRRVFGGGTSVWGGRCVPFDPIDFEKRSWIPNSGWPITYDQVEQYFERSLQFCEAGENNFDARVVFPGKNPEIIPGMDNEDMVSYKLERWSAPTRFAHRYKHILKGNRNVDIYLDAHVTNINVEHYAEQVDSVTVVINGSEIKVKADKFVLAAGGIENPRLLLSSKSAFHPRGIGNQHDNVGRYYMCHLMGTFGAVDPFNRKEILFPFELDQQAIYCRRRWWLTPKFQKQDKIGNGIMYLNGPINVKDHKEATESAVILAKSFTNILKGRSPKAIFQNLKQAIKDLNEHLVFTLRNSHQVIPFFLNIGIKRITNRRLPIRLPSIKSKWLFVCFQSEHMPNPESRIRLSEEKDWLGMPLPLVQVAFTELDIQTVISSYKIFFERFETLNKGNTVYKEDEIRQNVMEEINNFSSRAHHLGTTRMSDSPLNGVVDSDCKVHGMSNLYVAGSSVFPTGGHANPTLTLIALTLRLADHLKKSNLPPVRSMSYNVEVKPKKVFYVKALRLLSNITLIFSARN